MTQLTFQQAKEKHFDKLAQFTPIVNRVHGSNHPEFNQVFDLWNLIQDKSERTHNPDLSDEFKQLRQVTNDYTVPHDVCESYEAVYQMLAEVDQAYHA